MRPKPLPDFIVIGAMKSATTSLYWWLQEQPECFLAAPKETDFFSRDERWERGLGWYRGLFNEAPDHALLGEASVSYSHPDLAAVASARMRSVIPDARLIAVVRHPVERLRSHYRHEVQRGRERRPFTQAIGSTGNPYVASSCYFACLEPYFERFGREQICVVGFEDLVAGQQSGWSHVLRSLDIPYREPPDTAYNVSDQHRQWSPMMARLHRAGLFRFRAVVRLPRPIRNLGGRILMKDGPEYRSLLAGSRSSSVPQEILERLWGDADELRRVIGADAPLWPSRQDADAQISP
jgi:hypothetical protein